MINEKYLDRVLNGGLTVGQLLFRLVRSGYELRIKYDPIFDTLIIGCIKSLEPVVGYIRTFKHGEIVISGKEIYVHNDDEWLKSQLVDCLGR